MLTLVSYIIAKQNEEGLGNMGVNILEGHFFIPKMLTIVLLRYCINNVC